MKLRPIEPLKINERQALQEFKQFVCGIHPGAEIILYGSTARGENDVASDIDLMVVISENNSNHIEHELSTLKFNIELKYDVVIGLIVENRDFWQSARASVMPLHINIDRDGVLV